MARWPGLGGSPLLRRWPRLLWVLRRAWIRRLLCLAVGPDPVGAPLAPDQSLLLIRKYSDPDVKKGPGPVRPGPLSLPAMEPSGVFYRNFTKTARNSPPTGNIFRRYDL